MMKFLQVAAEAMLTGLIFLSATFFVAGADAGRVASGRDSFLLLAAGGYFVGFLINSVAEFLFRGWQRRAAGTGCQRTGVPQLDFTALMDEQKASLDADRFARLEQHEGVIRMSRNIAFMSLLLSALALAKSRPTVALLLAPLALVGILTLRAEVIRLVATAIRMRGSRTRNRQSTTSPAITDPTPLADGVSVNVLVFAGGTAFRNCNIALARRGHRVTRIVPSWDNGGSSRALRDEFGVLSIGDIRQALMTMAHGENNSNEVIRLFNWRLSEDADDNQLLAEMESFIKEEHPRIKLVPTDLRNVIQRYLETFWTARPDSLPLPNGSIGNFVLLGAFLAHGRDMNTAIYVFRQLCGIEGHVWPVSLLGDLHLCARLDNGETIVGEEQVTDIERPTVEARIESTFLIQGKDPDSSSAPPAGNPLVLSAFADADVIVFGPGSFFTSVLPHLRVAGVVDALANSDKPKLFVGNMREGNECYGWSLAELVAKFLETCHEFATEPRDAGRYLTRIVAHDSTAYQRGFHGDRFVSVEDLDRFQAEGIEIVFGDLEDPWKRGHHDGNALAASIINQHGAPA